MNGFGRLLEQEIPRLRRCAFALTRNMSRADDLVHPRTESGRSRLLSQRFHPARVSSQAHGLYAIPCPAAEWRRHGAAPKQHYNYAYEIAPPPMM
jgi:hypothetical protein